jgi:hypothetical protein
MMGFIVSGQVPVPALVPVVVVESLVHSIGPRHQGNARAGRLGDDPA